MNRTTLFCNNELTQAAVNEFSSSYQLRRDRYNLVLLELLLSPLLIRTLLQNGHQGRQIPRSSGLGVEPGSASWNHQASARRAQSRPQSNLANEPDIDHDDHEFVRVETYSDYRPFKLGIGLPHPDPVVETISLATVEPPDVTYNLQLPERIANEGLLSSLQLESVVYSCQQHTKMTPDNKTRQGFLIGDGAGVGKGRTIAGIIYENYLSGRKKSIWLSVSADLKLDAERDLKDIDADIPVNLLGKFPYGKAISADHGVVFTTYSGLISQSQMARGQYRSRFDQLTSWAGKNFDGVIIFDECHKAKNISMPRDDEQKKLTKAAQFVLKLQDALPSARVVYASATGASETRHLGYMTRLGIWGPGTGYPTFSDFCSGIERRGVSAMELVAVELKKRGSYIARQLSFKTTSFSIKRAPLTNEFIQLYDECVDMWTLAHRYFLKAQEIIEEADKKRKSTIMAAYWGAHQRFFKYLCISLKVPLVVETAKQAIEDGKCVVIGLQSTGEARTQEAILAGDVDDFVSTARETFTSLIDKNFPAAPRNNQARRRARACQSRKRATKSPARVSTVFLDSDGSDVEILEPDTKVNPESIKPDPIGDANNNFDNLLEMGCGLNISDRDEQRLRDMQLELYAMIDKLGPRLPDNTLDDLIHRLGGPEKVAEMTGRKGRLVKDSDGEVTYRARNEVDASQIINIEEKKRFMGGEKLISIISEAASSGISLQADRRVANQRRRVHITIELPWSADRAIQQFGRTHRSNQVSGPEYVFIISDLAGEVRFASIVARRLESLGALTHGDRRAATEQRDITEFNISADYCRQALDYINDAIDTQLPYYFDNIRPDYRGDFVKDTRAAYTGVGLGSWLRSSAAEFYGRSSEKLMNTFLNRILGMKVHVQNALFDLFSRFVDRLILLDKRAGQFERGIIEVNPSSGEVRVHEPEDLAIPTNAGVVECRLRNIEVDRGITWERALELYEQDDSGDERSGFYKSQYTDLVKLAICEGPSQFRIHKPSIGTESSFANYGEVRAGSSKISIEYAEKLWRSLYQKSGVLCTHLIYSKHCEKRALELTCNHGMRIKFYSILSGAILTTLPYLIERVPKVLDKLNIIRLRLNENTREIGPFIEHRVEDVRAALRAAQKNGIYWDENGFRKPRPAGLDPSDNICRQVPMEV